MNTRDKAQTNSSDTHHSSITIQNSVQAAKQIALFLIQNKDIIFASALIAYSTYKLAAGKINNIEIPLTHAKEPALYGWLSPAFPGGAKDAALVVDHFFPVNAKIIETIKSGMVAGILQCPITLFFHFAAKKIYGKEIQFDSSCEKKNEHAYYTFSDIRRCVNALSDEFTYRGIFVTAFWMILTKLGLSSQYAFAGSVLITQTLASHSKNEEARLPAFIQGSMFAGLTLFNKGNLWPAAAAHVTHELLTAKLNLSK